MAALEMAPSTCCAPEEQARCCEPEEKADCCAVAVAVAGGDGPACGCDAATPEREPTEPST